MYLSVATYIILNDEYQLALAHITVVTSYLSDKQELITI